MENSPAVKKESVASILGRVDIKKRFDDILGKKSPGFMSSIISATSANKELSKADPNSVVRAAAIAAALDLPINPSLGFAHIVPYKDKGEPVAQFQMGWKGFVQLAMRTGQYKTINAVQVYKGELVSRNRFTGEMELDESKRESDEIIGYVAYFRLINGFEKWLYMTSKETAAHGKRYSKSFDKDFGKWKTDFDAMSLKTVVKMLLSKYGILSIDMQTALQADQAIINKEEGYEYPDGHGDVIDAEEVSSDQKLIDRFKEEGSKG